jgi:hypothetical protein
VARTRNTRLPFGFYKGRKVAELPGGYLQKCARLWKDTDFHDWAVAFQEELDYRETSGESAGDDLEAQADAILAQAGFDKSGRRGRG